jgi:hypothetical protein
MLNVLPIIVVSVTVFCPSIDLKCESKDPVSCMKRDPTLTIIAQKIPQDPHGDDPHGGDPHDEVHDKGLPANENEMERKAPRDVYPKDIPNTKEPYYP